MDEHLDFEQLKISAFSKIKQINQSAIVHDRSRTRSGKRVHFPLGTEKNTEKNMVIITSENELPVRHILKELEVQRQEGVRDAILTRLNVLEGFSRKQDATRTQRWLKQQQEFIDDTLQNESSIFQALNKFDKNNSNRHAELVQHYQDLAERRKICEIELETRKKQRQIITDNIDKIMGYQQNFGSIYQQIMLIIKTCINNEELKSLLGDDFKLLKSLPEQLEEIILKCKQGDVTKGEVLKASDIVSILSDLKTKIEANVIIINDKKDVGNTLNEPPQSIPISSNNTGRYSPQNSVLEESEGLLVGAEATQYVSPMNLKIYTDLMKVLEKHTASFKHLEMDNSQKTFKFECKKAINTPVNSLSGISPEHILDKYNRLYNLLSGQNVRVSDKQINASSHPEGIAFCMDLLAKKLVLQGDLMVSSNPESAFCYASVIVSLWNEFPIFGKLILAYFYKTCPYLVPYYIPHQIGESDEEFYIKQGYQYNDGQIEKQDKFLKRMTGITRLYSALLIVKPKRGQNSTPYNIKQGWIWLASLLKLEPRVDITATVIHTFLETVGFEMEIKYGTIFKKIIRIIIEKFLPSCRQKCTGGAVTRLELLLNEYIKTGKFEKPNGYLGYAYW